jgi:hypothetical protein
MIQYEDPTNVRVVDAASNVPHNVSPAASATRSYAEEVLAENLDASEQCLRTALDEVVEGLEILGLFTTPKHRNLPTLLAQQIEEVVEYRRAKLP